MGPATIKHRITQHIKAEVQRACDENGLCGKWFNVEVTEPHPNTVQVRVTAPEGQVRYYFEIKVSQKM